MPSSCHMTVGIMRIIQIFIFLCWARISQSQICAIKKWFSKHTWFFMSKYTHAVTVCTTCHGFWCFSHRWEYWIICALFSQSHFSSLSHLNPLLRFVAQDKISYEQSCQRFDNVMPKIPLSRGTEGGSCELIDSESCHNFWELVISFACFSALFKWLCSRRLHTINEISYFLSILFFFKAK